MSDDLPAGLREHKPIDYGIGKKYNEDSSNSKQNKPTIKQASAPAASPQQGAEILNNLIQELEDAKKRGPSPMANLNPQLTANSDLQLANNDAGNSNIDANNSNNDANNSDLPPGLKNLENVNYNTTTNTNTSNPYFSDAKLTEMGLGAVAGAFVSNRQRKAQARNAEAEVQRIASLPPEMRPVNPAALQRYINSQFSVEIPLKKLNELTGMDIRTMKEVQDARRIIEGTDAQREPVVKDVNGRRTTVSYRSTPGQSPIDISSFAKDPPSIAHRIGSAIANGTKSAVAGTYNRMSPVVGGAVAVPQLMDAGTDYIRNKPVDPTQVASGLGGVGMMTGNKTLGALGAIAQLPYAIKHKDEILKNMNMNDINPLAFPAGTAESTSSPMDEPMSFGAMRKALGFK
jgi:hypothetical protein